MTTLAERLTSIQAAIAAIESGSQSYSILGRTYTKAELKVLYDQERYIESRIDRAAGARRTVAEF